jgi:hypothetical protein
MRVLSAHEAEPPFHEPEMRKERCQWRTSLIHGRIPIVGSEPPRIVSFPRLQMRVRIQLIEPSVALTAPHDDVCSGTVDG